MKRSLLNLMLWYVAFGLLFAVVHNEMYATTVHSRVIIGHNHFAYIDSLEQDTLKKVELNEVVVKSCQKIHEINNDVYIPTALQKKVSMDGYDLLRNMAIPQLDIDAITYETTVRGKAVTFVIDNHIVTNPNDVKTLSPNDILKVEYDAMPTGEYAQYDCIVKFTTKRKDRGGNIMANGMHGLNKNVGDGNGVVRFYKQRYEHSLAYAESHSHDEDSRRGVAICSTIFTIMAIPRLSMCG